MDLYGDLPPATGDQTASVPALGGWSQSQSFLKPRQISTPVAEEVKAAPVAKPIKPTSMFAFKPRQTSSAPAKSAAIVPSTTSTFSISINTTSEITSVLPPQPSPTVKSPKDSPIKEKENVEFNDNYSFDVEDAYDPRKPNDYFAYCEERLEIKKLKKLAEENKIQLAEQEKQREEYAKIRQKAVESGDFTALLNSSMNQNRGGFSGSKFSNFSSAPGE